MYKGGGDGLAVKKTFRVKKKTDFDAIFKVRKSFANRAFIVYQLDNGQSHFRVGLSVSKKLGNAVRRNRIKRLMRHALMALNVESLLPLDFVVIARKGVEGYDFQTVKKNLEHVLKGANIYQNEIISK